VKEQTFHSETCKVTQISSDKSVDAVVHEFREKELLHVILNRSVKLPMKWNGKVYEGRMAGMDFISHGPSITTINKGLRG
jgi:hypothetical protein